MKNSNKKKSEGLGDTVEYLLSIIKADVVVKSITSALGLEDCGCTRRKKKLNKLFPFSKK